MAEPLQFIDERLSNSITAIIPTDKPVDRLQPLTFTDWLSYNTKLFTTTNEFLNRYQSYLNNWYAAKGVSVSQASTGIKAYYTNLINEIIINYTSADEKRYLQNIDITDPRDLAIVVPFLSQKIKEICIYYSNLRDEVKTATTQYNLKGSNTGIENLLYVNIVKVLQSQPLSVELKTLNLTLSSISDNIVIDIEDLYDTYTDYYDISPTLPASAYNVNTGARNEYYSLNENSIDPYLFLNFNQSILYAILSYPFYTIEFGTNNFTIDPLVNSSQLNLLKDNDYISTVNDGTITNLNLQTKSQEITKYIGADFYYIATDTQTAYTSGLLFKADSEYANVLNKRYPSIAAIPSEEFLKTGKEIGLFFKPDKIGLCNFTNFNFTPTIDLTKLQPNSVYYFPDPSKYGNISGNSKLDFQSPLTFFENNYFNKIDFSNQYRFGDVATDPYYQIFRAYQSREQTLNYTNFGVQRYTDSQDFFTGDQDTIWNNADVYPITPYGEYPIAEKVESLLPINKTLVQYKSDVYGNQYGLYKSAVNKQFNTVVPSHYINDIVLDGYEFNLTYTDPNWPGWYIAEANVQNVNYTTLGSTLCYAGFQLRTSVTEVIGTDGNTPLTGVVTLPNNTTYVDNGGSFNDNDDAIIIESYDFKYNDRIYTNFDSYLVTYTCYIRDAETFISPLTALLPDVPSDAARYNPDDSTLYYTTLADASPQPNGPYGVATFNDQAHFYTNNTTNNYITETYDGNNFVDADNNPICPIIATNGNGLSADEAINYTYSYTEPANFVNTRLPNTDTLLDNSLSGINTTKKSIYYTRNVEYGDFYFRNANNTYIGPVSSSLSGVFINLTPTVSAEATNSVINFDIYYDTLQLETTNYLLFNKITYDYETNRIIGATDLYSQIYRGDNPEIEKFSTVWLNERDNSLIVAKTTLLQNNLSASNYKTIYPTIYTVDLLNGQNIQIYPTASPDTLTFADLSAFSLFGKNIELEIVRVEKPILKYSNDTDYYTLSYLGKDTANCFYIITVRFQYIQNTIRNMTCTMHKPATDVYNITFANQLPAREVDNVYSSTGTLIHSPYFNTFTIAGSSTGFIDTDNTFRWGYNNNA